MSRRIAVSRELWLVLVVIVTRLPFVFAGYGRDGDGWLVMQTASRIAATGHYAASRLPGYPLVEYAFAALPWKEPVWANGLTVLVTAAAAVMFYRLAVRLRCGSPFLLSLAFVMTPVVYVASAVTMDYLWALALILGSLLLALRRDALAGAAAVGLAAASGAALGLATGARITSALFALELVPLLATTPRGRRVRTAAAFIVGLAAAVALVWWPVLVTYGRGFLTFYEAQSPSLTQRVAHGTFQVWGLLGLLGLATAFVIEAPHGFAGVRQRLRSASLDERWWLGLLCALVVAELVVFVRLPHEAGYLIPVVPLVLLLAGKVGGKKAVTVLCVCLIVSPFLLNLDDYDFSREGQDIHVGLAGPILFDHDQRVFFQRQAQEMVSVARGLRSGDVLLAGYWSPYGEGLAAARGEMDLAARIRDGLTPAEVARVEAAGGTVYYLPSAAPALRDHWGLDLGELGLRPAPAASGL